MKKLIFLIISFIAFTSCSDITNPEIASKKKNVDGNGISQSKSSIHSLNNSDVWVGAYMASYYHYAPPTGNWGFLPTDEIDWDAFTHMYYFALNAHADGTLSEIAPYQNMSPDRINAIVSAAHNAGKPVIFTVGGWGNYDGFSNAITPAVRPEFISNLVGILTQWGFDGIDLDMEPIRSEDVDNYIAFINELHAALQAVDTPLLDTPSISAVTVWHADVFAGVQDKLDHINLMTYDLSGAWQGWESWHNSPVSNGGRNFQSTGGPLPSIEEKVKTFVAAGIPKSKLGVGIDFYGYVWSGGTGTSTGGVTKPNQSWTIAPTVTDNVPYHEIMKQYYQADIYHWDVGAKAAYLSIDESGSTNDKFISYDDENSIRAKFDYVRQQGLGGLIIWELAGGYQEDKPAGERDNLLQAVKQSLNNGEQTDPVQDLTPPSVSINAPAEGATVSGSIEVDIQAFDNSEVSSVNLFIAGTNVKNFTSAPYTYSWNTTGHPNQLCTLEARAGDAAGNTSTATVQVTISNSTTESPETPESGLSEVMVYDDNLVSPWINASWNASVDFNNTEQVNSGGSAIKVNQGTWGSLSVHSGNWGQSQDIEVSTIETVEFNFYATDNTSLSMVLENDNGATFSRVSYGSVPANRWVTVSIPMSELNPNNHVIHRLDILETSGTPKTYFVDNIKFLKPSDSSGGGSSSSEGLDVYSDALVSPWINASWNASVDFQSSEYVSGGSSAIKVVQNTWGGLSVHHGNWGQTQDLNPSEFNAVKFVVYTTDSNVSIKLVLENDSGSSFPSVTYGSVPANQWVSVSIPMGELNPNNHIIHRLSILETSGSTKTYYVDDIRLIQN